MPVILFTDTAVKTRRIGAYRIATVLRLEQVDVEVIDYLSKWKLSDLIECLDLIKTIPWVGFSATYLNFHNWSEKNKDHVPRLVEIRKLSDDSFYATSSISLLMSI